MRFFLLLTLSILIIWCFVSYHDGISMFIIYPIILIFIFLLYLKPFLTSTKKENSICFHDDFIRMNYQARKMEIRYSNIEKIQMFRYSITRATPPIAYLFFGFSEKNIQLIYRDGVKLKTIRLYSVDFSRKDSFDVIVNELLTISEKNNIVVKDRRNSAFQ